MTNSDLTLIAALLDRTGSMESSKEATEDGFNELISALKADPGQAFVTLAQFDKYHDAPVPEFVYQNKPINDVPKLALIPRGMTPLLDAAGAFITQIGQDLSELKDNHRPGLVICVIMTDGMENASREWTWESVRALIKQQSEVYNWKFMFSPTSTRSRWLGTWVSPVTRRSPLTSPTTRPTARCTPRRRPT